MQLYASPGFWVLEDSLVMSEEQRKTESSHTADAEAGVVPRAPCSIDVGCSGESNRINPMSP
jgi:hypothetical protein